MILIYTRYDKEGMYIFKVRVCILSNELILFVCVVNTISNVCVNLRAVLSGKFFGAFDDFMCREMLYQKFNEYFILENEFTASS